MVSYTHLPYDILHQICVTAQYSRLEREEWEAQEDKSRLSPRTLINFSMVDRRTRDAAVPVMFQSGIVMLKYSWLNTSEENVNSLIDALLKNEQMIRAIK